MYTLEDYEVDQSLTEELEQNTSEIGELTQQTDKAIDTGLVLESLSNDVNPSGYQLAAEMAVSGLAIESAVFNFANLSLEEVKSRKASFLAAAYDGMKQIFQKQLDFDHYGMTLFNVQKSRLNSLSREVSKLKDSDRYNFSTRITKYLIGKSENPYESMDQYLQEYRSMVDTMSVFAKIIKDLADDDLFSSLKQIKSAVTFSSKEFFIDRFDVLEESIKKAEKIKGLKQEVKAKQYTTYATDVMPGGAQLVVTSANKAIYAKDDFHSIVDSLKHFYMYVYRTDKIRMSTIVSGSRSYSITGKQLKELVNLDQELLEVVNQLLNFTTQLSTMLTSWTAGSFYNMVFRTNDSDYDGGGFFRSMRILNRISAIIYDSVASTYNFSMGNIKKSATIVENAINR